MAMRIPRVTDFAAMCVELTPFPHPKDIVIREPRKAITIKAAAALKVKRDKGLSVLAEKRKRSDQAKKANRVRREAEKAARGKY